MIATLNKKDTVKILNAIVTAEAMLMSRHQKEPYPEYVYEDIADAKEIIEGILISDSKNKDDAPIYEPVLWRWEYENLSDKNDISERCFNLPLPDEDIQQIGGCAEFPRKVQVLYAIKENGE